MSAFLTAAWDVRYPLAGIAAIICVASAAVVWHQARKAPLIDDYGPRVMHGLIERDPDESVAEVVGWVDHWAAWEAEVASW